MFLKKINLLEDQRRKESDMVVEKRLLYPSTFRALDRVVGACFGVDLDPAYTNYIRQF